MAIHQHVSLSSTHITHFSDALLAWFYQYGRHHLPWQFNNLPTPPSQEATSIDNHRLYAIWVSEIMLQQTQVTTVLNYFAPFIQKFPSVSSLAQAKWEDIAPLWAGLGYYARARHLHVAAQQVAAQGKFPDTLEAWQQLKGIGQSTAGALMALGQQQFGVIMDGNVKRVLMRYFALALEAGPKTDKYLWHLAQQLTPSAPRAGAYAQAMMDLGATLCTRSKPQCLICPFNTQCQAHLQQRALDFPPPKRKKTQPQRYAHVLVIRYQDTYLWHQRASEGLWGGLWTLPIFEQKQDDAHVSLLAHTPIDLSQATLWTNHPFLQDTEAAQLALLAAQQLIKTLPTQIKHIFTHFTWHLTVNIVSLNNNKTEEVLLMPHQAWLTAEQAIAKGIPTAMKKVLKQVSIL